MAKKSFLTSGKLMEAVRKLDYMGQYKVCEAFFQMMAYSIGGRISGSEGINDAEG